MDLKSTVFWKTFYMWEEYQYRTFYTRVGRHCSLHFSIFIQAKIDAPNKKFLFCQRGTWCALFLGFEEIIFDQDLQLCLQVRAHQSASADLQSLADQQRSRPDLHADQQRADLQSDWRSQANLQSDQRSRPDLQSDQRAWADLQFDQRSRPDLQSDQRTWANLQTDQRARSDLRAREQKSRLDLLAQPQGGQLARLDPQAGLRIRVRIKLSC
jgi:hypothetical protein